MFNGLDFTYNGRSCSDFNLQLINFNSGKTSFDFGPKYNIIEEKARLNDVPLFFGVETDGTLELKLIIGSEVELDRYDKGIFSEWLFQKEYKELVIEQEDLEALVYYGLVTSAKQIQIANYTYAIEVAIQCDRPYALTTPQDYNYTKNSASPVSQTFYHYCETNLNDYLYPETMSIYVPTGATSVSIINHTDSDLRVFEFSSIAGDQTITINNKLGIISSTGDGALSNFSKKWFRLLPGDNEIEIIGDTGIVIDLKELSYPVIN